MWNRLTATAKIVGILVVGGLTALGGNYGYQKYLESAQRELLIKQLVLIANYNIQQGKLVVPPELQAPKPSATPATPAAPPAAPPPVEK